MPEQTETTERYIRINITKNTKGYAYETTVSLRWTGSVDDVEELKALNRLADEEARAEIEHRRYQDHAAEEDA